MPAEDAAALLGPVLEAPGARARRIAPEVGIAATGFCAFLGLYATQPLLPTLQALFGIEKATAALTVSAATMAVALASPLAGLLATRLGHRRVVLAALTLLPLSTLAAATATSVPALVAWRFAQGLVVPFAYTVALAWVAEEWPVEGLGRAMSALVTGNVIGGCAGRVLSGTAAQWGGWRASFVVLAAVIAAGAVVAARGLPRGGAVKPGPPLSLAGFQFRVLLREPRVVATCAVGFNVLFTLVATFTYVTFRLAAEPFRLGAVALSWIFLVYLAGAVVVPFAGRWIDRVGSRRALTVSAAGAIGGGALTLAPVLGWVVLGLAALCTAVFVSQAASTSFLRRAAPPEARSAASGLYVSCYYLGGAVGGVLPAAAWRLGGWPACVALVAAVQLVTIAVAARFWGVPSRDAQPGRRG